MAIFNLFLNTLTYMLNNLFNQLYIGNQWSLYTAYIALTLIAVIFWFFRKVLR